MIQTGMLRWAAGLPALVLWICSCTTTGTEGESLRLSPGASSPTSSLAAMTPAPPVQIAEISSSSVAREPWDFAGVTGQRIITPHYRVHTTVNNAYMLEQVPLYVERALMRYTSALAPLPAPREPFETYLFASRRQWEAKTRQMLPEQAKMYLNLGRGGFTTRGIAVLYDIDAWGASDTLAIAAHEGWHQYTQQMFANPLPVWLEEGIATYMEGHSGFRAETPKFLPWKNSERFDALRAAARTDRLIPLSELFKRSPQTFLDRNNDDLLTYYAQVWALTHFLVEGEGGKYRSALADLLTDAASGRIGSRLSSARGDSSLHHRGLSGPARVNTIIAQEYFNRDLAALDGEYARFVQGITAAQGARSAITDGRNPLAPRDNPSER